MFSAVFRVRSVAAYAETLSDDKSYRLESKKAYKKNKNIEEE